VLLAEGSDEVDHVVGHVVVDEAEATGPAVAAVTAKNGILAPNSADL